MTSRKNRAVNVKRETVIWRQVLLNQPQIYSPVCIWRARGRGMTKERGRERGRGRGRGKGRKRGSGRWRGSEGAPLLGKSDRARASLLWSSTL